MLGTITLDDVSLYRSGRAVVSRLSASFEQGSLTALVGPNGGGKSTLLEALAGMLPLCQIQGRLNLGSFQTKDIGYLPQKSQANCSFPLSVQDVVAGGLWNELGYFRAVTSAHRKRIAKALDDVGLEGFMNRPLTNLSFGQFQRILFARLSLQNRSLLLLDEPFNGVDEPTQDALMDLIHAWQDAGKTLIIVLHDQDTVRNHFPRSLWVDCQDSRLFEQ